MRIATRLSVLCLVLVLSCAIARSTDDTADSGAKVAAATSKMASTDPNVGFECYCELSRIARRDPRVLVKLLNDDSFHRKLSVIGMLGYVGGKEQLPILKKFADAVPETDYGRGEYDKQVDSPNNLALESHLAIVHIIEPDSKDEWQGSGIMYKDRNLPEAKAYRRRVEETYRKWAASQPATSTASAPAPGTCPAK
jgi:hypothetical protein